jgi:hypothetical protein
MIQSPESDPQQARYWLPWNASVLATRFVFQSVRIHLRSPLEAWAKRAPQ